MISRVDIEAFMKMNARPSRERVNRGTFKRWRVDPAWICPDDSGTVIVDIGEYRTLPRVLTLFVGSDYNQYEAAEVALTKEQALQVARNLIAAAERL